MKRTLLAIISAVLVLASIFGLYGASAGIADVSGILRYKNIQKTDMTDSINLIEQAVKELDSTDADRKETELEFAEGVVTGIEGPAKINAGQAQIDAGQAQINKGQAEYDAGLAKYNQGKAEFDAAEALYNSKAAEYNAAQKQLEDGKRQLAEAKAQRAAGQAALDEGKAKLDAIAPAMEKYSELNEKAGNIPEVAVQLLTGVLSSYGYGSTESLLADYDAAKAQIADGERQLAEADVQIADAEKQIADGEQQLAVAKAQLDDGRKQLDGAKAELADGKAQLDAGKAQLDAGKAELSNAKNQLNAGKETVAESSDKTADALNSLKEFDTAQQRVDNGIAILLENKGIADKVTDEHDYEAIITAAREFVEEDAKNVDGELTLRQQMCSLLRILSIIGIIAGIMGVLASYAPSALKLRLTAILSAAAALGTAVVNVYGLMNGYPHFVYSLADGSGSGKLLTAALVILFIVSAVAACLAVACVRSYNQAFAEGDVYEDAEEPAPVYHRPAVKAEPTPVVKAEPDPVVIRPQPAVKAEPEAKTVVEKPAVPSMEEIARLTEEARRMNEEADRMESAAHLQDYEKALKEYEEARRRYEQLRGKK